MEEKAVGADIDRLSEAESFYEVLSGDNESIQSESCGLPPSERAQEQQVWTADRAVPDA